MAQASTPAPAEPQQTSATTAIGRLRRVPPAELWGTEPARVVTWLQSNLEYVGEVIGLPLVPAASPEVPGSTNALLAAERNGDPVLVVVELGASSDERFGVLLRQMVASTAKTAIWVSGEPKPDHVASVSWLNRAVDGRFYVVRLEAVQIGDSAAAPVFTCTLRPPRASDAIDAPPRSAGEAPDGQPGRRAEDWSETLEAAAEPGA
jgi:hypothetical protein